MPQGRRRGSRRAPGARSGRSGLISSPDMTAGGRMRSRWLPLLALAALSCFIGGWLVGRGGSGDLKGARLFREVFARVSDAYVDSVPESELYQRAADGLLESLNDPYTVLLTGEDYGGRREATTGNFGGIGIQIDVRDGWITVVAPLPDTPAERAGISTGDRIVVLDGRSTEGWKNDQAVKELRGQAGTQVELKVRRVGVEQPLTFKLTRATIHIRSVQVSMMLDDKVGYISLSPV